MKFLLVLMVIITSCGVRYTTLADKKLEKSNIRKSSFLALPIIDMDFVPHSSCFSSTTIAEESIELEEAWNKGVEESVTAQFPEHSWKFIKRENTFFEKEGMGIENLYFESQRYTRSKKIKEADYKGIEYVNLPRGHEFKPLFTKLAEENKYDYIIFFVKPKLYGRTDQAYNYNVSTGRTSNTYTVTYNADVIVQVWDIAAQKMIFNTGAYATRSAGCCFFDPVVMAINGATDDIIQEMNLVIATWMSKELVNLRVAENMRLKPSEKIVF